MTKETGDGAFLAPQNTHRCHPLPGEGITVQGRGGCWGPRVGSKELDEREVAIPLGNDGKALLCIGPSYRALLFVGGTFLSSFF